MSCPGADLEAVETWRKCGLSSELEDSEVSYLINSERIMRPQLDQWQWRLRRG